MSESYRDRSATGEYCATHKICEGLEIALREMASEVVVIGTQLVADNSADCDDGTILAEYIEANVFIEPGNSQRMVILARYNQKPNSTYVFRNGVALLVTNTDDGEIKEEVAVHYNVDGTWHVGRLIDETSMTDTDPDTEPFSIFMLPGSELLESDRLPVELLDLDEEDRELVSNAGSMQADADAAMKVWLEESGFTDEDLGAAFLEP